MLLKVPNIRPMLQPDGTGLCGQVCVAMVANVSLAEAVTACGTRTLRSSSVGTTTQEVMRGLRKLKVRFGEYRPFPERKLPNFAIAEVCDNKTQWGHWVVLKEGFVYDPGIGWPIPVHVYEDSIIERAYSRRYKRTRDAGKRVKGKWGTHIPIYGRSK